MQSWVYIQYSLASMVRLSSAQHCWMLCTLLLLSTSLSRAQDNSAVPNGTTSETAPANVTTSQHTSTPTAPPSTRPITPTSPTMTCPPITTSIPCHCADHDNTTYIVMTAVFGVLLLIAILLSCALLLVVCSLCSKRSKREPEIRQYVFEEGIQPPELWVDPNAMEDKPVEHQPDIWEVSTFSPSPSKDTTMTIPNVQNNGGVHPVPVPQPVVAPKQTSRSKKWHPKRVAPPPPKKSKRKRFGKSKSMEETVVYAVPAPYLSPVSRFKKNGYDVPKSPSKEQGPHIYKSIDVSQMKAPNAYAGLVVGSENK